MIKIANNLKNDYLLIGKLKNFCIEHNLRTSENKADLIANILEYAGNDNANEAYIETYNWILEAIKEGSKEICYKKIYFDELDESNIEEILKEKFPKCPNKDILNYFNTSDFKLVNFEIIKHDDGRVKMLTLLFSKLVLEGPALEMIGEESVYPVYIDIYFDESFITSRAKSKATIYKVSENKILYKKNRINTLKEAVDLIDFIIKIFNFKEDGNKSRQKIRKMLYRLYSQYSFTPEDVVKQIGQMELKTKEYVIDIFNSLNLKASNISSAMQDLKIILEKYISINGDIEKIFKEDRDAYLIKISSDDQLQMTRIDTSSAMTKPLQCTDVFYDGKKSIMNTKECKKLNLCYNRKRGYLSSFPVQFIDQTTYGVIKMQYFPEEVDIQNVLQTVFENY